MGFVSHFGVVCTAIRTVAEVNKWKRGLELTEMEEYAQNTQTL